jgi:hypothetical protein
MSEIGRIDMSIVESIETGRQWGKLTMRMKTIIDPQRGVERFIFKLKVDDCKLLYEKLQAVYSLAALENLADMQLQQSAGGVTNENNHTTNAMHH